MRKLDLHLVVFGGGVLFTSWTVVFVLTTEFPFAQMSLHFRFLFVMVRFQLWWQFCCLLVSSSSTSNSLKIQFHFAFSLSLYTRRGGKSNNIQAPYLNTALCKCSLLCNFTHKPSAQNLTSSTKSSAPYRTSWKIRPKMSNVLTISRSRSVLPQVSLKYAVCLEYPPASTC